MLNSKEPARRMPGWFLKIDLKSIIAIYSIVLAIVTTLNASQQAFSEDHWSKVTNVKTKMKVKNPRSARPQRLIQTHDCNIKNEQPSSKNLDEHSFHAHKKISDYWLMPEDFQGEKPIILLELLRDGTLTNVSILRSSNDPVIDNQSIEFVKQAGPFAPLPNEYKGQSRQMIISYIDSQRYREYTDFEAFSEDEMKLPEKVAERAGKWTKRVVQAISKNWEAPYRSDSHRATYKIYFHIPSGDALYYRPIAQTCDPQVDKAIFEAITTAKLPKPDFTWKSDVLMMMLKMEYTQK